MLNFKELQEFKHVVDDAPTTTTNLAENKMSMNLDGELPWDDPLHYFAVHAVKSIQNRSNSLLLYELQ